MGVHGLKFGQIFVKCQCVSFLVRNNTRKTQIILKALRAVRRASVQTTLRAVRRAIVESCCSVDDLSWKLFGRILYNFEAFCGQGASFGMLFGSILNPWGHFWSNFEPLESFLEHFVHIFWC